MPKPPPKNSPLIAARLHAIHLEISGNREIIVEGSRGILLYREEAIKLNAGNYILSVSGRGLHIKCMSESDLVIQGFITGIEYLI